MMPHLESSLRLEDREENANDYQFYSTFYQGSWRTQQVRKIKGIRIGNKKDTIVILNR